MSALSRKALTGFLRFQGVLALSLFLPAWSLRYWEAWVYWVLFSVSVLLITLYFLKLIRCFREIGASAWL